MISFPFRVHFVLVFRFQILFHVSKYLQVKIYHVKSFSLRTLVAYKSNKLIVLKYSVGAEQFSAYFRKLMWTLVLNMLQSQVV